MKDYVVKLRFWLRAYDSAEFPAATDAEAFHIAKAAATRMMGQRGHPEEIDMEERREGLISYVDTMGMARSELAEGIVFDDDRPLHPEARRLVRKLAAVDPDVEEGRAKELLRTLIGEARSVPADALVLPTDPPLQSRPWSVDQVYEYRGRPGGFIVDVVDQAGVLHALDPRLDLRNHSPTGFSWGYSGSGPAQLALAILCHALHCDERAVELYQEFKDAVVAHFDQTGPWHLTTDEVLGWVLKHPSVMQFAGDA
ncbi:hypothetical protein ATER59S_00348 [Aquamicrobium terrae]